MRDVRASSATLIVVDEKGHETVVAHLDPGCPDMVLVDVLARVQLATRRGGLGLLLRDPSRELRELIDLCGLGCVLALEPRGQPELGEELGVEEVMQPGDLPA
jgi:hypothetical protein